MRIHELLTVHCTVETGSFPAVMQTERGVNHSPRLAPGLKIEQTYRYSLCLQSMCRVKFNSYPVNVENMPANGRWDLTRRLKG